MTTSVYVTSPEGHTGKSSVALGLVEAFARRVQRVGVFRPISRGNAGEPDSVLHLLVSHATADIPEAECVGVDYDAVHTDPEAALATIVARYREIATRCDAVVIIGSDYTDVAGPTELAYNARRSEEHTSELQSRGHLVCRLLLEKKKHKKEKTKRHHNK